MNTPLFKPGRLVATPGAIEALEAAGVSVWALVSRHLAGDDGELDEDDRRANKAAVRAGGRIFSAYTLGTGEKVWVITEADRNSTCVLTPAEY